MRGGKKTHPRSGERKRWTDKWEKQRKRGAKGRAKKRKISKERRRQKATVNHGAGAISGRHAAFF